MILFHTIILLFLPCLLFADNKKVFKKFEEWRVPEVNEVQFEDYRPLALSLVNRYIISDSFYNITKILDTKTKGTTLHWWNTTMEIENTDLDKKTMKKFENSKPAQLLDRKSCNAVIILNPWNGTMHMESFSCQNIIS